MNLARPFRSRSALLLAGAAALPACSSGPAAAPDPRPSASATSPAPRPVAAVTRDSHARPAPGELKTFADWTVGCDNAGRCAMASLGPDGGDFPPVTVEIARDAGPAGAVTLRVLPGRTETAARAIEVDGRRFALDGDVLSDGEAMAAATTMAGGRSLAIVAGSERHAVSLAGASASLRYVDARQGRAGTVTALVARGAAPAQTVPAASPMPDVVAVRAATAAAATDAQWREMRRIGRCEDRMADGDIWTPRAQGYADGTTLVLLPCSAGAYNEIDALFTIRDGRVAAADVDAASGFEATGADPQTPVRSVINGAFDKGMLTSFAKGRGLGDCGSAQRFAWDGRRLRLIEQTAMGECRGNPNYLTVWRARAVLP